MIKDSYPKMLGEVIEAIETYYCDDKDVMIDCLLYLMNATSREEDVAKIEKWMIDHHRCYRCGAELAQSEYREYHPEVGYGVYEVLYEEYCPECGGLND